MKEVADCEWAWEGLLRGAQSGLNGPGKNPGLEETQLNECKES